jgi:predicted metal-dependent peptidase
MSTTTQNKKQTLPDNLIGPTDPLVDKKARDALVLAKVTLLNTHPFFGNLSTRMQLVNADEWCDTAATDGIKFYYNSRFINLLDRAEVEFLVGHEVLHVVYDHLGRREGRQATIWNVANDYAINADLKKHKIGRLVTSVPCLYEPKYEGMISEAIYEDLMKNVKQVTMDELVDMLLDDHIDPASDDGDGDGDGDDQREGNSKSKRPKMTKSELEAARREAKQAIIAAAQSCKAGDLPANVSRLLDLNAKPKMNWKELIQTSLTSLIKNDFSWQRVSRKGWDIDAIMPGMLPSQEIDVSIAIDMSGSISDAQAKDFLAEIQSIMDTFDGYRIHVLSFDTQVYNPQDFRSDNLDSITGYTPYGGGGTDFTTVFRYLRNRSEETQRLIFFTDGYPGGSWGDPNLCDVVWIIHGSHNIEPPFGTWAYLD